MATFETWGATVASSIGTAITPGDAVKGSYVQLIASSGILTKAIWVFIRDSGTRSATYVYDFATGAAAAEVNFISNLTCTIQPGFNFGSCFGPIRVDIPSGTRISARAQTDFGAGTEVAEALIIASTDWLPDLTSPVVTLAGTDAGTSPYDTAVDPGGTANTKGSWVEISAAAPANAEHFILAIGDNANVAKTTATWLVDIAIGAAGSEVVHIANLLITGNATTDIFLPTTIGPLPADGMQSQRVSVRAQCTITDATDRVISVFGIFVGGTEVTGGSTIYVGSQNTQVFPVGGGLPSGSRF